MAKKFIKRALSVGLSLVLCGSMVVPSLAAVSFDTLQSAINDTNTEERWYGQNDDGTGGISARTENGTRNVKLYDDVVYGGDPEAVPSQDIKSIEIKNGANVNLDLNGKTIDGGYREKVKNEKGEITQTASNGSGQSVIKVTGGSTLTIDGKEGTIKGGFSSQQGGGIYVTDSSTIIAKDVTITGNKAKRDGGGISASRTSRLNLTNVHVDENTVTGWGGGMFIEGGSTLEMNGGSVARNKAITGVGKGRAGGIYAKDQGNGTRTGTHTTLILTNVNVDYNTAANAAGGISLFDGVHLTMTGGSISNNTAELSGGGMFLDAYVDNDTMPTNDTTQNVVRLNHVKLAGNHAGSAGGGIYSNSTGDKGKDAPGNTITLNGVTMTDNVAEGNGGGAFIAKGSILNLEGNGNEIHDNTSSMGDSDIAAQKDAILDGISAGSRAPDGEKFDSWSDTTESGGGKEYNTDGKAAKGVNLVAQMSAIVPSPIVSGTDITGTDVPLDDGPEADDPTIEITDPAVPLASGPITRAQFIDYLWRHEGEPETDGVCTFTDVPEDHTYVLALAWAEQNEVAFPYEDGTFEPDELITVGAAREFLDNFAKVFGTNAVAAADLKSLTGGDDEAVLNCGEVLAEFFGEEYQVPELPKQDELDDAA